MSEVERYYAGNIDKDRLVVLSKDYDAAQAELAALREELASMTQSRDYCNRIALHNKERGDNLQQRLTAAERRNAELLDLMRKVQPCISTYTNGTKSPLRAEIDAALKPTESGSSE